MPLYSVLFDQVSSQSKWLSTSFRGWREIYLTCTAFWEIVNGCENRSQILQSSYRRASVMKTLEIAGRPFTEEQPMHRYCKFLSASYYRRSFLVKSISARNWPYPRTPNAERHGIDGIIALRNFEARVYQCRRQVEAGHSFMRIRSIPPRCDGNVAWMREFERYINIHSNDNRQSTELQTSFQPPQFHSSPCSISTLKRNRRTTR